MKRNLQTVVSFANSSPFTVAQVRWLIFNAGSNGLSDADAIVRVGRRVYIDIDRFDDWLTAQNKPAGKVAA
jgi:hypothetical protein